MKIFKRATRKQIAIHQANMLTEISSTLTQVYGELNRMRLIQGDPRRAKSIEKFDKENNHYAPFFGSEKVRKEYKKNANG